MRVLKLGLISFVVLFLMATAFSLLIPSNIRISKAINIHAEKDSVLALVKEINRWPEWHPAFLATDTTRTFPEIAITTVGLTDSTVVMELSQGNKRPVINGWNIYTYEMVDSLTLQWYMDFRLKWYPWQKLGSLFYEGSYGRLMEEGLTNIKKRAQNSK